MQPGVVPETCPNPAAAPVRPGSVACQKSGPDLTFVDYFCSLCMLCLPLGLRAI